MSTEIEGLRVKGLSIKDFLKESFSQEISNISPDIDVVALVMMKKNGEKAIPIPIVFNHQTSDEAKNKILHLDCSDEKILNKMREIFEKIIGDKSE